jgi:putative oxidoreductase
MSNVALGLLGLLLFVMGGGAVSIDRLFRRKKEPAEEDDAYNHTAGAAT